MISTEGAMGKAFSIKTKTTAHCVDIESRSRARARNPGVKREVGDD